MLRGFTLIEMLITLAVLVILTTLAAGSMNSTLNNNRAYATQDEFVAYLALARSEAARRGVPVVIVAIAPVTGNAFGAGWNVFVDANANGAFDTGETVLRSHDALPSSFLVGDGTTTSIAFGPLGFLVGASALDIKLCPTDPTLGGYDITVQANGLTDVQEFAGNPSATGTRMTC
jgi:type IV fimbrial biogenesis protein FimT